MKLVPKLISATRGILWLLRGRGLRASLQRLEQRLAQIEARINRSTRVVDVAGGHLMILHEHDSEISTVLRAGPVWEPAETALVEKLIQPGSTVLDIGANIGYFTLLFARQVGPQGKVFALEPDPTNFALLRQNLILNGYRNVVALPLAASDYTGAAQLHLCTHNMGDHRLYDSGDGRQVVAVEAVRLDDLPELEHAPVNFIKMDIQGSEDSALRGMTGLLRRSPRLTLLTEFWPYGLQRSAGSPRAFLEDLCDHGFRLFQIDESGRRHGQTDLDALIAAYPPEQQTFTNLLCLKA